MLMCDAVNLATVETIPRRRSDVENAICEVLTSEFSRSFPHGPSRNVLRMKERRDTEKAPLHTQQPRIAVHHDHDNEQNQQKCAAETQKRSSASPSNRTKAAPPRQTNNNDHQSISSVPLPDCRDDDGVDCLG